jgi:hypothetical protein
MPIACKPEGELTIILDSNLSAGELEVVMVPVDPAPLLRGNEPWTSAAQADSLAKLAVFEDSAATLDRTFLGIRDDLNADATRLSRLDRRSDEYADRFGEFQTHAARADSLRDLRDRMRDRASDYRIALKSLLPDSARIRQLARDARARLDGAADNRRRTFALRLRSGGTTIRVEPGTWWIGLASDGLAPTTFERVVLAKDAADTLRLNSGAWSHRRSGAM